MFLRHSAVAISRRATASATTSSIRAIPTTPATRSFTWWFGRKDANKPTDHVPHEGAPEKEAGQQSVQGRMVPFEEVRTMEDLLPPGGEPGTIPTDENQSTGLERLEILGKMQGVDVFDMRPLDASRKGTLDNPIPVNSFGFEQFAGCTGYPVDSHHTLWLRMDRKRPVERCPICGSVYEMQYVGPPDEGHEHDDHHHHKEGHVPNYYEDGFPELRAEVAKKQWWEYVRPEYHKM